LCDGERGLRLERILEHLATVLDSRHHGHIKAYSEDLRRKIVEAVERGTPKSEAARSFGVGISSVKHYVAAAREGRPLAPKKRPGSKPKLDEDARRLLEADLEERPAATLPERREFLGRVRNFAFPEFSEVQLRFGERSSVRRVMSSSCSQPSPTKE
jgi:transposase-like protein